MKTCTFNPVGNDTYPITEIRYTCVLIICQTGRLYFIFIFIYGTSLKCIAVPCYFIGSFIDVCGDTIDLSCDHFCYFRLIAFQDLKRDYLLLCVYLFKVN